MTGIRKVAIAGLGLIGGSLARDLSARGLRVLGYDRDPGTLRAALGSGCVHAAMGPALEGLAEADVLIIAVPVASAPDVLATALPHLGGIGLVTDAGSTKQGIGAAAQALGIGRRFIGSHPLTGDHRSGWPATRTGLFDGARVFLCPTPSTDDETRVLATELWASLGAHPEIIAAEAHDRHLAWISHLPQATSTAVALALASAGIARSDLGPGGRDLTRLAGSSAEMWTGIALENAACLSSAVSALESRLGELRAALARRDEAEVRRFFAAGREWSEDNGRGSKSARAY